MMDTSNHTVTAKPNADQSSQVCADLSLQRFNSSHLNTTSTAKHSYASLWLLVVVAALPLAAALASYFGGLAQPQRTVNRGALVLQQPPLSKWQLTTGEGVTWQGQGKWQLLLVAQQCQQQCQQWRYLLGQIKTSLGRDRHRIDTQLVLPSRTAINLTTEAMVKQQDKSALISPRAQVVSHGIWLADPLGNLVLYYRFDQPPQDLIKDLKRLLKVSKVG